MWLWRLGGKGVREMKETGRGVGYWVVELPQKETFTWCAEQMSAVHSTVPMDCFVC